MSGFTEEELRAIIRDELRSVLAKELRDVHPKGQYMTVPQMAEWLNVDEGTVRRRVASGAWPHARVGKRSIRFSPEHQEAIEEIIDNPGKARTLQGDELNEALEILINRKSL